MFPFHPYDQIPIQNLNPPNPIIISNSNLNPNAKHDEAAAINANISPNFFSNFPSPFFDDDHELPLNQIFPKPPIPIPIPIPSPNPPPPILPKKESPSSIKSKHRSAAPPRKRTGKKDRHSKICTAQGIRDRRMRLSLQVARKFFDLQDMLGYDKASKTIEWLFTQSKRAIKDLAAESRKSAASSADGSDSVASECEVLSGIEEISSNTNTNNKNGGGGEAREKREQARARARCRTEEKKKMSGGVGVGGGGVGGGESSPNSEKLGSSRICGAGDYASTVAHAPSDAGTIENLLASSMGSFLGNWDQLSSDHHHSRQIHNYAGNSNSIYSPDFPLFHQ